MFLAACSNQCPQTLWRHSKCVSPWPWDPRITKTHSASYVRICALGLTDCVWNQTTQVRKNVRWYDLSRRLTVHATHCYLFIAYTEKERFCFRLRCSINVGESALNNENLRSLEVNAFTEFSFPQQCYWRVFWDVTSFPLENTNILEDRTACNVRRKQWLLWLRGWRHYDPSKRRDIYI
jgi:hypothetical protein